MFSKRLASAIPKTAPLPCPTCKGPVGLEETNSSRTLPEESLDLPQLSPALRTFLRSSYFCSADMKMFINPGPSTLISVILLSEINDLIISASSLGLLPKIFESLRQQLEA